MKKNFSIVLLVASMLWTGAFFAQAAGPNDAVETTNSGIINWTTNEVMATGIGAPPAMITNPAQARAMAERAAFIVALRNLLETVKGVRVDSETVVRNFMVKSDVIRVRVDGIVKGAKVVKTQYLSDGSVEVQVALSMRGAFLDAVLPESFGKPFRGLLPPVTRKPSELKPTPVPSQPSKPTEPAKPVLPVPVVPQVQPEPTKPSIPPTVTVPEKKPEPIQPLEPPTVKVPEAKPEPSKPVIPPPATVPEKKPEPVKPIEPAPAVSAPESGTTPAFKGGTATGVVVDGRGLGLRPALLPKIIDPQGQEIYVGQVVTRTNAVEQGVAGYAKDVNAAASNFRVTDNPAVIKGVRASGSTKTDIMVSQADAQMLRQLSSKGDFLQNCRVIIVY
jgi:hypothetical protein